MPPAARGAGSGALWLALGAVGTFAYGVEHWRGRTADRATRDERARFHQLATCVLGADGESLVYAPAEARRRLRTLAMATPLDPSATWLDRCVPIARDLAVHGAEVDVTHTVGSVATHVGERSHELALALARVGLVWRVRAGDPDADMDTVADLLTRTAAEIGLAEGGPRGSVPHARGTAGGAMGAAHGRGLDGTLPTAPTAPTARALPRMVRLAIPGLVPLPLGTPGRFSVGAPLPLISTVSVTEGGLRVDAVANVEARFWRQTPQGLVRIVLEDGAADGLAPVLLDGPTGRLGAGRIAAPPSTTDRAGVSLDATAAGGVLWLAEAVRGQPPTLCRLAAGTSATAARLGPGPVTDARGVPPDEEVAVGVEGPAVYAAFTRHTPGDDTVAVSLVRAAGGARAAVEAFTDAPWHVPGRRPRLAFCHAGETTWLFAAGRDGWQAGVVHGRAVTTAGVARPHAGQHWDETVTVRCAGDSAVAYGRERPRNSPVFACRVTPAGPVCSALAAPPSPQPADLALYATDGLHGEHTLHMEWPMAVAPLPDGALVAARAAGTMVAVNRLDPGATQWRTERVVLDAALDEHGTTVTGVELYANGPRVLLVAATPGELRAAATDDGGGAWGPP